MSVVEATIADLRAALDTGRTSSVRLVAEYLERIAAYDHHGPVLNSVPVLDPGAFAAARASDERRARGEVLSVLDGIPYTVKDSYRVAGLPVSAGSPAFAEVVAAEDAFSVGRLRAAGAVCLGTTTMPPLANGGMQRGLHGRAESPYNPAYLTSAWASGSSNGSGTSTAASLGAFGLGEETWSSGRAPANNNSLCAYTPSRGVISLRGNWPLVPTMDVVVPQTRTMADLLAVLDVMVQDDPEPRGDFWRVQDALPLPASSEHRPASYPALAAEADLSGKRIGVPRIFLGKDGEDGGAAVPTRESVVALAEELAQRLRDAGAEVVECDLPALSAYEGDHAFLGEGGGFQGGLEDLGYLPRGYLRTELIDLAAFALDDFLRANAAAGGGGPARLADAEAEKVFPTPLGQIEDEYGEDFGMGDYVRLAAERELRAPAELPELAEGLRGLDRARRELFDEWLDSQRFDALLFPTSADIAPAEADQDPAAHQLAWRNGTWVANGNLLWRHLGIPTVTVPLGPAEDIGMPFGATLAGRGGDDVALLRLGCAVEAAGPGRVVPGRVPALPDGVAALGAAVSAAVAGRPDGGLGELTATTRALPGGRVSVEVTGRTPAGTEPEDVIVSVDGVPADVSADGTGGFAAAAVLDARQGFHSQWRPRYGHLVVALAATPEGDVGECLVLGGC